MNALLMILVSGFLSGSLAGWQDDIQPRRSTVIGDEQVARFHGNQSSVDHFKLLEMEGDWLLVGARNIIYNVSLADMTENKSQRLEWHATSSHREMCIVKGRSEDDCQNYIRVLARVSDDEMLVCGTNAYTPLCRRYERNGSSSFQVRKEFSGKGLSPYDPNHNSTAVYSDGELYAGTVSDFSALDPLIYRDPLRTEQYDLKHLNAPSFVHSLAHGDYVYFFFRETAVEYINCGKSVYSRVGRVCKNDKGGPHRWASRWTSFLKSRLNCSLPGDYPFYFNEIQSTSDVIDGTYGHRAEQLIYGVFTTPQNSIFGSAVCAFRLRDIGDSFDGAFKEQASMNSNWLPASVNDVPEPRPGQCVNDSRTLPEVTLNFIKSHSLMDEAVDALYGQPIVTHTSLKYKFTKLAIDPQVRTADGKTYDVLIIGTDKGKVIRVVNAQAYDSVNRVQPIIIEELQVFPNDAAVTNLKVVKASSTSPARLVVVSNDEIRTIPLRRCGSDAVRTCSECVALQDPYCAWDPSVAQCVAVPSTAASSSSRTSLIQSILTGYSDQCADNGIVRAEEQRSPSTTPSTVPEPATCAPCQCPCADATPAAGSSSSSSTTEVVASSTTSAPAAPSSSNRISNSASSNSPSDVISGLISIEPVLVASEAAKDSIDVEIETNVIGEEDVAVMAAAALDAAGVSRRNRSRDDGVVVADTDADVDNALPGPKVGASAHVAFGIYSAETFTIAVVVSCFAALIIGFIGGLAFSRRCQLGAGGVDYSVGFRGAPYLEQRRLSRLNETISSTEPNNKMNNFIDQQQQSNVKIANEKNANNAATLADLKPHVQKVKKTYV